MVCRPCIRDESCTPSWSSSFTVRLTPYIVTDSVRPWWLQVHRAQHPMISASHGLRAVTCPRGHVSVRMEPGGANRMARSRFTSVPGGQLQ